MHLVFLTPEYPLLNSKHGGVGSFVQSLAKKLILQKIDVSIVGVYSIQEEKTLEDEGVKVYGLPKSKWKIGKFYQNIKKITKKLDEINKKNKIDIIEGAELSYAFFPKKTSYQKVIRMHGGHHFFANTLGKKTAFWRSFQEIKSFKKADALIAVSNFVGNKTNELLHFNKTFTTIYNIIDIAKFHESDPLKMVPETLLFVGTVCEKKGVKELVQSISIIKKKYPNIHLKIAGRDWFSKEGESYTDYLKSIISKEDQPNISFLGAVLHEKIPILIESTNICVYPSHMEAMPIAWLEGLGMGKPVVGGRIGPGYEAIIDKETGLLADPKSPEDIAEKIIFLLENKDKALAMGKNARKDILKRFNPDEIINQNIQFYKTLLF